jgi:transglutaminase-like putative cysteine protease
MLRRRGITSRVCLGVTRDHGDFSAHAWVEVGKNKIVHAAFKRLAEFGDAT